MRLMQQWQCIIGEWQPGFSSLLQLEIFRASGLLSVDEDLQQPGVAGARPLLAVPCLGSWVSLAVVPELQLLLQFCELLLIFFDGLLIL
jgi:hypothetical protein